MSLGRPTTLLHVSDIHFKTADREGFDSVWRAFRRRLLRLRDEHDHIDFVCLTGDFVYAADDEVSYSTLLNDYFLPLFDDIGCHDRVMFCPGNHDASRAFVAGTLKEHRVWRAAYANGVVEGLPDLLDLQEKKFGAFQNSCGALASTMRIGAAPLNPIYYDKEHDVGFVCVNSALLSLTGLEGASDERELHVPTDELSRDLAAAASPAQWIFLMHHPFDWLNRKSAVALQRIVSAHKGILLHGHMHEGRPSAAHDVFGSHFQHQSGALFSEDPDRFNGFSLLRVLPGHPHYEVNLQSYFPLRTEFDAAVEICEGGQFHSSEKATEFWRNPPVPTNLGSLRDWIRNSVGPHLEEEFRDPMADRPLTEIFVEPPLARVQPQGDDGTVTDELTDVTLDELLSLTSNLIFLADAETSRSTVLRAAAIRLLACSCNESGTCTVPVILNFAAFAKNAALALRSVRNSLADGLPSDWTALRLAEHGMLTLFVDDFNIADLSASKALADFMRRYPKNRFILAGIRQFQAMISPVLQLELPLPFTAIEIGAMRTRHVRALISRWRGITPEAAEPLQKKIIEDSVAMNLPLTGSNIAILIQLDEVPDISRPVNRAALVERYIELLLRKSSLTALFQAKYDFHNKVHFLAWVAAQMVRADSYLVESQWIEASGSEYVKKYQLDIPFREWIQQFLTARILKYENGQYSFKFRVFLEFFIAQAMKNDREIFSYVTDSKRYLYFANEIDFYAGIVRTDATPLDLVAERFETMRAALMKDQIWAPDLEKFNTLKAPRLSKDRPESLFKDVERQLSLPPMTYDQRDQVLDIDLPEDVGKDQQVRRPLTDEESADTRNYAAQVFGTLALYSRLVKSTELIEGGPKRKHVDAVLTGWAEFWFFAMNLIPILAKERKATIAGVTFVVAAPKDISAERLGYDLYVNIPVNVARTVYSFMGSDKLRMQLEEGSSDADKIGAITFLKRSLSLDLKTSRAIALMKLAFVEFQRGSYLHLALLAKARSWWLRNTLGPKEHEQVVQVLAAEVNFKPGSTPAPLRYRQQVVDRDQLLKDELIVSIRRHNEENKALEKSRKS